MRRHLFLSICFFGIAYGVLGQQPASEGVLKDAEFLIKKERKHLLPAASRLFETAPTAPLPADSTKSLEYNPPDLFPEFDTLSREVRILRAKQDIATKLYNNYIRGGYGNFHTPLFEGCLSNKHDPRYVYGLRVSHLSTGREAYAEENHNLIQLHGKLFTKTLRLGGDIGYHRDQYQLYDSGYVKAIQTLHQVTAWTTLSNYIHGTFNYQVDASFYYLSDACQAREKQWRFNGRGGYELSDTLILKAFTDLYLTKHSDTTAVHRNLWRFKPMLFFKANKFDVQGGFNLVCQDDVSYAPDYLHIYPVFEAKYALFEWLQPYLGIGGDMQQNSLRGFLQENPLLAPEVDLRHTNQYLVCYGGARGDLAAQVNWHAGFSVGKYQNLHCLVNSALDPGRFEVKYDPATTLLNTFGELTYTNQAETSTTRLRGDYFHYMLRELLKPWHRPRYQLDLTSTYCLHSKLVFRGALYWLGERVAQCTHTEAPVMLNDVVDVDLGIEYLWNSRFSVFFDLQNLLANKNERYLHYPTRGFHCMLGLTYAW
jgi:hypothetical protein